MDYVVNENGIILEIEPKVKTMSDAIVDRLIYYRKKLNIWSIPLYVKEKAKEFLTSVYSYIYTLTVFLRDSIGLQIKQISAKD